MADVLDILGKTRTPAAERPEGAKPKKEPKMKRPEGMSREAFALLGDSHPIMTTQLMVVAKNDVKAKPKPSTKGIVTWSWTPITSSARQDGWQPMHWHKGFKDAAGRMKDPEDPDYYYAKFNKKVQLIRYNDEEYESLIAPYSGDWSRDETNYLLELCERFDLRFLVIADRYEYAARVGHRAPAPPRGLEDLKERYYSVARRLLVAREGSEAPAGNQVLVKHPFNKNAELERKRAIEAVLRRTPAQAADDNAILAEAKAVEERRRAEAAAQKRSAGPSAAAGASAPGQSRLATTSLGVMLAAGAEPRYPDRFPNDAGPGVPSLFDINLEPCRLPKPGVVARGAHTVTLATTMLNSLQGGVKAQKAVEQSLTELGGPVALLGPRHGTQAVTGAWLALRAEIVAMHELKRQLPGRADRTSLSTEPKAKKRR